VFVVEQFVGPENRIYRLNICISQKKVRLFQFVSI